MLGSIPKTSPTCETCSAPCTDHTGTLTRASASASSNSFVTSSIARLSHSTLSDMISEGYSCKERSSTSGFHWQERGDWTAFQQNHEVAAMLSCRQGDGGRKRGLVLPQSPTQAPQLQTGHGRKFSNGMIINPIFYVIVSVSIPSASAGMNSVVTSAFDRLSHSTLPNLSYERRSCKQALCAHGSHLLSDSGRGASRLFQSSCGCRQRRLL